MSYQTEFPAEDHPPADVVAWLEAHGFEDQSWHNNAHPSWDKGRICVWATSKETAEAERGSQFCLTEINSDGEHCDGTNVRIFNDWDSCVLEIESILEHGWLPV